MPTLHIDFNRAPVPCIDSASTGDTQWIQISPYGDHLSRDGKYYQRINRQSVQAMVDEFNRAAATAGASYRGVPVYHGHPGFIDTDTDDARRGKLIALQARDDGFYGQVKWNNLGLENREQGYWPFPSAGWQLDTTRGDRATDGRLAYQPTKLHHVGLVNDPNITSVEPVTNSAPYTISAPTMKLPQTHAALGLSPTAEPDDDTLLGAIKKIQDHAAAVNAQLIVAHHQHLGSLRAIHGAVRGALNCAKSAINESVPDMPSEDHGGGNHDAMGAVNSALVRAVNRLGEAFIVQEAQSSAINAKLREAARASVDLAINSGHLSEADRETWTIGFVDDFAKTARSLHDKKVAVNARQSIVAQVSAGKSNLHSGAALVTNAHEAQAAINSRLKTYMEDKKLEGSTGYNKAWQAIKADPANKPFFDLLGKVPA